MSSISLTKFGVILIGGVYFLGPVPRFLFPDTEVGPDVGNGSSDMSSNISGLNEGLRCRLLILR